MPTAPSYFPFRPAVAHSAPPAPQREASANTGINPLLPTPSVLAGEVDTSMYEPIPFNDWVMAPTDYSESPPSDADSPGSLPQTPTVEQLAFLDSKWGEVQHPYTYPPISPRSLQIELEGYHQAPAFYHPQPMPDTAHDQSGLNPHIFVSPAHTRLQHFEAEPTRVAPYQIERPASSDSMVSVATQSTAGHSSDAEESAEVPVDRVSRDNWLLDMRDRGYSYKDIKRLGNFREAESTLRGRIRMLTKDKSERVRKPKWTANDVSLLHRAVRQLGSDDGAAGRIRKRPRKMPWKKVSEWMSEHGSSYEFAPATCAKKFDEVN